MRSIPLLVAVILLIAVGSVVVTQKLDMTQKGYELGRMETESRGLQEQIRLWEVELSRQTSLSGIQQKIEELDLPLDPPLGRRNTG